MEIGKLIPLIITLTLLLVVGFAAGKTKIIDEISSARLSAVTVKIGQPFLIINGMIGLERTAQNVKIGVEVLLLSIGMHAVMGLIAFLCAKGIRKFDERKISEFAMIFANCGFIGFPILESIFGDTGPFYGAFYVFGFNVLSWTWGIMILARKRDDIKMTPRRILLNFGTVPAVIGFLLFLSGIPLHDSVKDLCSYLGNLCTPLAMLITGANLARRSLKKMFTNKAVYLVNAVKLLLMPLALTTLLWLLGFSDTLVMVGAVLAALPSAAVVTMFGEMYEINPGYAAELVGSTSVLCMATLVPMIYYAQFLVSL